MDACPPMKDPPGLDNRALIRNRDEVELEKIQ